MNDALLSASVDFVCLGIPGIATIWAKTKGGLDVKAASGFNFLPLQLNTRSPNIKSIRDLTDKDKIAMPAVKVSQQAILLQMAAAQTFRRGELRQARRPHRVDGAPGRDGDVPVRRRRNQQSFHLAAFHAEGTRKARHHQGAELGRRAGRADLVQRGRGDEQVLQRKPQTLRRVHQIARRSDRIHQQGQARGRGNLHQDDQGQEPRRGPAQDHERSAGRIFAACRRTS